jgi:predicted nucleotidyltransferase
MVGSQAKRTAVASSDYDLWVDVGDECVSRAQRKVLRNKLTSMLTRVVILHELREEHIGIAFSSCCFSSKVHHKPAHSGSHA